MFRYNYFDSEGVVRGTTDIYNVQFYGLSRVWYNIPYSSGQNVNITKEQFRTFFNAGGGALSNYKAMGYHKDGSTRDLFNSDGYLICPFCE